jgi:hypothetical protein
MRKYLLILCALALIAGPAAAETVNVHPYGTATPKIYDFSVGAIGSYYLDIPTLSANDTICGLAATQTLTNKTLTSPTVTTPTITSPTITGSAAGAVPIVVQQGYTQFSHSEATTVDVTGAALTLADGYFTEGKTYHIKAGGTVTGINGAVTVALYLEDGAVCTMTTGSAAAGDWMAEFTITSTGAATQRIVGHLIAGGGTDIVSDYAADTTNSATAGTIPLKLQVGLANAADTITCEYWSIEHWTLTD